MDTQHRFHVGRRYPIIDVGGSSVGGVIALK